MKHILVIIVLLVFTLAPALAQAPAPAKETPLLSIATKVALPSGVNEDTYFWFSDHQVLFFRLMPLTKQQLRDLGPVVSSLSKGTEVRRHVPLVFDNKTRKLTPLEPFFSKHPAAFLALGGPDWSWTAFPSGSQDSALSHSGEWLLWLALSGKKPVWIASRIDGSKEIKWPASGSEPVWAPDSHHWVELRESESAAGYDLAVIHDLRTPSLNRKVKIDPSEDGITQGVTANGSLVLSDFDDEHPN
ncbi:MAG TPA: hypothetical protein VFW40_00900, partial [Capsulimonadaceae bacterium]|nr:hypothetical protein [Capsulimonadaceae bacterium]